MSNPIPTAAITLDGHEVALAWNAPARYRVGTLGDIDRFSGLAYSCAILWAAGGCKRWRTPDDMAEHVEAAGAEVVNAAVAALFSDPDAEKKSSSASGPSPASTSA